MQNAEAERTILGAVLVEPSALAEAAATLVPEHFSKPAHQDVYRALVAMADEGRTIDLVTVKDELARAGHLERIGGAAYLSGLVDGLPRLTGVEHWCEIVRDHALQRRVLTAAKRIEALAGSTTGAEALDGAFAEVMAAADQSVASGFLDPQADLMQGFDLLSEMANAPGGLVGMSTGLGDLDDMLGGLKPGQLVVVGARPAMGKSAFATHLGDAAARGSDPGVVAMFSLEMSREELAMRRLCAESRISLSEIRGNPEGRWTGRVALAMGALHKRPFFVDDTFQMRVSQMRAKARRLKMERKRLDLVIVDYLQLMEGDAQRDRQSENRVQEVSAITRSLKGMAKDLGCPVVALSQLSRKLEERKDKRPQLSDLRESGSIEQDADVVLFLYRDEVYHEGSESAGVAEIIVAKQRNGPTGTVRTAFLKDCTRFEDLAHSWQGKAA